MYCSKCGKQIAEQSQFCNYCGAKVDGTNRNETETSRLLLSLKPEFHGSYVLKKHIPVTIFFTFFISIFIIVIRSIINFNRHSYFHEFEDTPFDGTFFILAIIIFMILLVVGYKVSQKRYEKSEFLIYTDKMEYIDGYFNYNKKQIYFKNVIEVSMSQNIFQRNTNIGNITLTTTGINHYGNRSYSNGIHIYDIPNIENTYQELKKIIK